MFKKGDYKSAINAYSLAIRMCPNMHRWVQFFKHPYRQTMIAKVSMCERSRYPTEKEMGLPRNIAIELREQYCPEYPQTSQRSCVSNYGN
ncbi:hypothetical protein TNCV_4509401 [Trichonephila clavipes]|nr:hypothetical protein TNCV_4509401 [Trichonephila clavipes]